MILTITCNPAIDKTYNTTGIMVGQVNTMRDLIALPGGKGINVTKVLNQFGAPVTASGFLGGYTGEFIEEAMKKMEVVTEFIPIRNTTRSNMNIIGDDGYVTEILEPGPHVTKWERDLLLEKCRKLAPSCEAVVLSGSLTDGLEDDFYGVLIDICREAGSKVFLDTSGEPLKKGIAHKPYYIKPNRKELEYAVGRRLATEAEVIQAAYSFVKDGVSRVVVSLGAKGLLQITKTRVIKAVPPKIHAVNTVGSGDSVVAAMVLGLIQKMSDEDTMQLAAGISAANATTLESGMIPRDTMEEIIRDVAIVTM